MAMLPARLLAFGLTGLLICATPVSVEFTSEGRVGGAEGSGLDSRAAGSPAPVSATEDVVGSAWAIAEDEPVSDSPTVAVSGCRNPGMGSAGVSESACADEVDRAAAGDDRCSPRDDHVADVAFPLPVDGCTRCAGAIAEVG